MFNFGARIMKTDWMATFYFCHTTTRRPVYVGVFVRRFKRRFFARSQIQLCKVVAIATSVYFLNFSQHSTKTERHVYGDRDSSMCLVLLLCGKQKRNVGVDEEATKITAACFCMGFCFLCHRQKNHVDCIKD